jgi:hypothetical protein
MAGFIVERYWPGVREIDVRALGAALGALNGVDVVYLGCIMVPGDEVVLFRFEAASAGQVEETGSRAGLRCDRVLPAVFMDSGTPTGLG